MIAKREIAALLAYLEIVLSDSCEIGFACAGTIGNALAIMGKIPAVAIAGCLIITGGKPGRISISGSPSGGHNCPGYSTYPNHSLSGG